MSICTGCNGQSWLACWKGACMRENHGVSVAYDARPGLEIAAKSGFDLIVLDWMLPGINGPEVVRRLRAGGEAAPILIVTASDGVPDIVKGLQAGADDFLVKPFSFAEFLAKVGVLGQRARASAHLKCLKVDDLVLDTRAHRVSRGRQELLLSPRQYRLIEFLMRRQGGAARGGLSSRRFGGLRRRSKIARSAISSGGYVAKWMHLTGRVCFIRYAVSVTDLVVEKIRPS